eukprot:11757_1
MIKIEPSSDQSQPSDGSGSSGLFTCEVDGCDHTSEFREIAICHRRRHSRDKEYRCVHCGVKFSSERKHARHLAHNGSTALSAFCELCNQRFRTRCIFNAHKKQHFADPPPPRCDLCLRSFENELALRAHSKVEQIEEMCVACGCVFTCICQWEIHLTVCAALEVHQASMDVEVCDEIDHNVSSNESVHSDASSISLTHDIYNVPSSESDHSDGDVQQTTAIFTSFDSNNEVGDSGISNNKRKINFDGPTIPSKRTKNDSPTSYSAMELSKPSEMNAVQPNLEVPQANEIVNQENGVDSTATELMRQHAGSDNPPFETIGESSAMEVSNRSDTIPVEPSGSVGQASGTAEQISRQSNELYGRVVESTGFTSQSSASISQDIDPINLVSSDIISESENGTDNSDKSSEKIIFSSSPCRSNLNCLQRESPTEDSLYDFPMGEDSSIPNSQCLPSDTPATFSGQQPDSSRETPYSTSIPQNTNLDSECMNGESNISPSDPDESSDVLVMSPNYCTKPPDRSIDSLIENYNSLPVSTNDSTHKNPGTESTTHRSPNADSTPSLEPTIRQSSDAESTSHQNPLTGSTSHHSPLTELTSNQSQDTELTSHHESPDTEPIRHLSPDTDPTSHLSPLTEPTSHQNPVTDPTSHQSPVTEPIGNQSPDTEPTSHQSPVTEHTSHLSPVTEPTSNQSPVTEPTNHQSPDTKPTSHQRPDTEPTRHQSPDTEDTSHQSPDTELTRHQSPDTEPTSHQSPGTNSTRHQSPDTRDANLPDGHPSNSSPITTISTSTTVTTFHQTSKIQITPASPADVQPGQIQLETMSTDLATASSQLSTTCSKTEQTLSKHLEEAREKDFRLSASINAVTKENRNLNARIVALASDKHGLVGKEISYRQHIHG